MPTTAGMPDSRATTAACDKNLMNLELIGRPFGFQLCVLPIKWMGTTGAPVRAIAIVED